MIIGWIASKLANPWVKKGAVILFAFFIGLGIGNYHATQRAVAAATQAALEYGARREAAVGEALIKAAEEDKKKLDKALDDDRLADEAALDVFQKGIDEAKRDRLAAERVLSGLRGALNQEKVSNDELRKRNEILAPAMRDVECGWPSDVRRVLDAAADAGADPGDPAADRDAKAVPAGGADATATAGAGLTCDDLLKGYVELGEHASVMRAWVEALQAWVRIAYGAE